MLRCASRVPLVDASGDGGVGDVPIRGNVACSHYSGFRGVQEEAVIQAVLTSTDNDGATNEGRPSRASLSSLDSFGSFTLLDEVPTSSITKRRQSKVSQSTGSSMLAPLSTETGSKFLGHGLGIVKDTVPASTLFKASTRQVCAHVGDNVSEECGCV